MSYLEKFITIFPIEMQHAGNIEVELHTGYIVFILFLD